MTKEWTGQEPSAKGTSRRKNWKNFPSGRQLDERRERKEGKEKRERNRRSNERSVRRVEREERKGELSRGKAVRVGLARPGPRRLTGGSGLVLAGAGTLGGQPVGKRQGLERRAIWARRARASISGVPWVIGGTWSAASHLPVTVWSTQSQSAPGLSLCLSSVPTGTQMQMVAQCNFTRVAHDATTRARLVVPVGVLVWVPAYWAVQACTEPASYSKYLVVSQTASAQKARHCAALPSVQSPLSSLAWYLLVPVLIPTTLFRSS